MALLLTSMCLLQLQFCLYVLVTAHTGDHLLDDTEKSAHYIGQFFIAARTRETNANTMIEEFSNFKRKIEKHGQRFRRSYRTKTAEKKCLPDDSGCSCTFNDGSGTVDLTSLGNTADTPRYTFFVCFHGNTFFMVVLTVLSLCEYYVFIGLVYLVVLFW